MPRLQFKGKVFVENHHLAVPFHELIPVREKGLTEKASLHDNLIVHGDNLAALKSLLPTHQRKVKCIYIDPPYNTGNDGLAYPNYNRSPILKRFLLLLALVKSAQTRNLIRSVHPPTAAVQTRARSTCHREQKSAMTTCRKPCDGSRQQPEPNSAAQTVA